jgi:isopenicillin N synthase-like dioxygenase
MNFGEFLNGKAQQPLPPIFAEREAQLNRFHDYCHDLVLKILRYFAVGLKIDREQGGNDFL